jgi:hypothetical protein
MSTPRTVHLNGSNLQLSGTALETPLNTLLDLNGALEAHEETIKKLNDRLTNKQYDSREDVYNTLRSLREANEKLVEVLTTVVGEKSPEAKPVEVIPSGSLKPAEQVGRLLRGASIGDGMTVITIDALREFYEANHPGTHIVIVFINESITMIRCMTRDTYYGYVSRGTMTGVVYAFHASPGSSVDYLQEVCDRIPKQADRYAYVAGGILNVLGFSVDYILPFL